MQQWGRIALLAAMFVTAYLIILAWQKDYGPDAQVQQAPAAVAPRASTSTDIPSGPVAAGATDTDIPAAASVTNAANTVSNVAANSHLVEVFTDVYHLWIDPQGGDVVRAELLQHDLNKSQEDKPFVMLENDANRVYIAQSGLIGANGPDAGTNGRPSYETEHKQYRLQAGQQELVVPLVYKTANGVEVIKSFNFKAGQYPIHVNYRIINRSNQPWQGQMFGQIKRDNSADPSKSHQGIFQLGTYLGGAWGTPDEQYNKLKFDNFQSDALSKQAKGGWVGIVQHYFVTAWIPDAKYNATLETRRVGDNNVIGFRSPTINVPAGMQYDVGATLYTGPKIQSELKDLAAGLNQTVDYGWLWPIAQVLFIGLKFFHGVVGNWGWAIILLTCAVKLVLFPLSAKSYRSMAKMRLITPEMQRLKEEHGEDRMKFSQEMMALYKREQVNPLSGCLPLLLQMPIFLALYWVLMESVELRHAPWLGWIQDLSAMDPLFILPLLMGVTMYVQQMLNPQPTDPMQAKVFKLMPIIFTVFLLFFPAGLVLYWIVNNLLTILQQWLVNRSIAKEAAARTSSAD
ncbi:membrane protein insertase YidC [Alkanindiges sp. WGS2144]|uniref:membrane protein insertase YidC n=1 Tax=Alkanindiges sp. WGS2144 TaxID=3366808 RepID=UPI003752B6B9